MGAEVLIYNLIPEDATAMWQLGYPAFDWPSGQFLFLATPPGRTAITGNGMEENDVAWHL
jgi:hypothetical protein